MTIVITGANRGIGAALLEGYAKASREAIGTARSHKGGLAPLDVTDPAAQKALAKSLDGQPVELLICNAGLYLEKGQRFVTGYAPELWAQTFATNVTGVFLTIQALMPNLKLAEGAKIAIISSQMASDTKASGGSYIYRASKAAALNLGRNLATDLRKDGIAVGIYHPGWVKTDMGGAGADIGTTEAASGLIARFDALSLETTGCFETWDGRAHPF